MKFAAIDIGSNAVRLLFCNVYNGKGEPVFKKTELIRVPLRLGEDVFISGKVFKHKIEKLITSMKAFKGLIDVHDVVDYRACGTSALRDASNSAEIIERIKKEAGINVEIIDGATEADIIYNNHITEHLEKNNAYLYIDVGGGSCELTLFDKNKVVAAKSFNIGTIRLLHNKVSKDLWHEFKEWIKEHTKDHHPLIAIGSGGNINKLFAMSRKKQSKPITYTKLKSLFEMLKSYSYEERICDLGLKPDRADVIIPATKIFLTVMKHAEIEKMYVPQIGLSDGIVHLLYEKHKGKVTI